MLYFIVITTDSFAQKTIPKLKKNIQPPNIIIYGMNSENNKKLLEQYNFIGGAFTQPSEIFSYLLDFQSRDYNIPLFSYGINNEKEFNFNYFDYIYNKEIIVDKNNFSLYIKENS